MAEVQTKVDSVPVEVSTRATLHQTLWHAVRNSYWQKVHIALNPEDKHCKRLYANDGDDIALVQLSGDRVFAISASCPHADGPLDQGDIEDLGDRVLLLCPVHMYDFNLATGESSSGLKVQVFPIKFTGSLLYINTPSQLAQVRPKFSAPAEAESLDEIVQLECINTKVKIILQLQSVTKKFQLAQRIFLALERGDVTFDKETAKFYEVALVVRGRTKRYRRMSDSVRQLAVFAMELSQFIDKLLISMVTLNSLASIISSGEGTFVKLKQILGDFIQLLSDIMNAVEEKGEELDCLVIPPVAVHEVEIISSDGQTHLFAILGISLLISLARELEFVQERVLLISDGNSQARSVMEHGQSLLENTLITVFRIFSTTAELAHITEDSAATLKTVLSQHYSDYVDLPFHTEDDRKANSSLWYQKLSQLVGEI